MATKDMLLKEETIAKLSEHIAKENPIKSFIVVRSKKTGKDVTFRLKSVNNKEWGYSVFIGFEQGYDTYTNCAVYSKRRNKVSVFKKYLDSDSVMVKASVWVLNKIVIKDLQTLFNVADYYHTGRCVKCGKKLTDLTSIMAGMGSYCRTH